MFKGHWTIKKRTVTLLSFTDYAARTMPRLTAAERNQAIARLQLGESRTDVANRFGVALTTVSRLWTRFQANGNTADNPRTGRPRMTSSRQDRTIVHRHRRNSFETAAETARRTIGSHGRPISSHTVRRWFQNEAFTAVDLLFVLFLLRGTDNRNCFGPRIVNTGLEDIGEQFFSPMRVDSVSVMPTDEFVFGGEEENAMQTPMSWRWTHGVVMIWVAIGLDHLIGPIIFRNIGPGRGNGVTAQRYINQVLRPVVLPYIHQHNHLVFQHDNARAHSARNRQLSSTAQHQGAAMACTQPWHESHRTLLGPYTERT